MGEVICDRCNKVIYDWTRWRTKELELSFLAGDLHPEIGYKECFETKELCDTCVECLRGILVRGEYAGFFKAEGEINMLAFFSFGGG